MLQTNRITAHTPGEAAVPNWVEAATQLIAGQSVLGRLPERELRDLVQRSTVRTLRARQRIYRCGDPGRSVIAVLDGYVKLSSLNPGGREVVLEIVRPGKLFGELAVLNDWPRDTDATTLTSCRLLAIDRARFTQVMERSPEGLQTVVQLISQRTQAATQRVLDAALPGHARLAKVLMYLAGLKCQNLRDGACLELQLSQTEIGGMTGLTRESINKHLGVLRDAGWIAQAGTSIVLLNIAALEKIAEPA